MSEETLDTTRLAVALEMKRGRRGLRSVAQETGVAFATLSRIERGHAPDVQTFIRLCAWLGMSMERFVIAPPKTNARTASKVESQIRKARK